MAVFRSGVQKLIRYGNSTCVSVPRPLLKELGLKIGDHIAMRRAGGSIVIVPIEQQIRARFKEDEIAASTVSAGPLFP